MPNRLRRNPAWLSGRALFQKEPVKSGRLPFGPRHYSLFAGGRVNFGTDAIYRAQWRGTGVVGTDAGEASLATYSVVLACDVGRDASE